jgi:hypothetical protein
VAGDFNTAHSRRPRTEGRVCTQKPIPRENMTSTRIELAFNKVARMNDASDLAELLFPGNRNQQHAFLVIWISLKWETPGLVPNLNEPAQQFGISRRTLERVRAKLRRLGLIDHVSRFNARHGYREGWTSSPRFEHALRQLAGQAAALRSTGNGSREKDDLLLQLAAARRASAAGAESSRKAAPPYPQLRREVA